MAQKLWFPDSVHLRGNPDEIQWFQEVIDRLAGTGGQGATLKNKFDANTILKADTDNTPEALTVGESRMVGRKTGGSIDALTPAEIRTLAVLETVSQSEAEAGTATTTRAWTAERVKQAIAALGGGGFTGYARISRTSNQSIPHNSETIVNFDTEDEETEADVVDLSNNKLVVPAAWNGKRGRIVWHIKWASSGANYRFTRILYPSDSFEWRWDAAHSFCENGAICPEVTLSTNDEFQAKVYQPTGGSLNLTEFIMQLLVRDDAA